jgi:hypothetical protein
MSEREYLIAKSERASHQRRTAATLAAIPYANMATPFYAGSQAKKGRKAAVGFRSFGRQAGEGMLGMTPGMAVSRFGALTGKRGAVIAGSGLQMAGALGGGAHGAHAAMRNAQRRGDVK